MTQTRRASARPGSAGPSHRPWFLRTRGRRRCHVRPVTLEGHLLTAGFAAWVSAIAWWMASREPGTAEIVSAIAIVVASTTLYIVTVLRMSAPAPGAEKGQ